MDEGAGWEQQAENERRRYEEEQEARVKEQRAWGKHWRDTWTRWVNKSNKEKSNAENW